jgi:4-amino-4-deoxy-L-arabinose transferase-like glycosyltransferase
MALLMLLVAAIPRLWSLNTYITWDEPMWVFRSIHFLSALLRGDLQGTFLVGHPGVITMICGSIGIAVKRFVLGEGLDDFLWLSQLATLEPNDALALRRLGTFLPAAKLPLVLLSAVCIAGIYSLARRLFGWRVAVLAGLLLALDPFHLALTRVLHIDGATANFMMLSLLLLLLSLRRGWQVRLVLSGVLAGLAFLTKSYSLFLVPFAAWVILARAFTRQRPKQQAVRQFALWCLGAGLALVLLWPAVWAAPVRTISGMLQTALGYAALPSETADFFLGQQVEDPGPLFYPLALGFRTTPLAWLGVLVLLAVALWSLLRPTEASQPEDGADGGPGYEIRTLLSYALLFAVLMTLASKKFDRYMLPVIVALDMLAALGLAALAQRLRRRAVWTVVAIALLAQGAFVLWHHPYYLAYYNPLLGGIDAAQRALPLGWGDGMNLAADYLNQKDGVEDLIVATGGMPGFAPLFQGQVLPITERGLATSDYAIVYVSDVQQQSAAALRFANAEPEAVLQVQGTDYAWIYPNLEHKALMAFLSEQVEPDDAVLVDALSPLSREYPDVYPIYDADSEIEVSTALMNIAARHSQVWYVSYSGGDPQGWARFRLGAYALLINQEVFPYATVSRYLLPEPASFVRAPVGGELNSDFEGQLRLKRYELTAEVIEHGRGLGVTLYWQAQQQPAANYAVSLRLLDEQGHIWAQQDAWLLNDAGIGTSAWSSGQQALARYLLHVPAGIPPGPYQLQAAVYNTESLITLQVLSADRVPAGTEQRLAEITVNPPSVPRGIDEVDIRQRVSHGFGRDLQLVGYGLPTEEVRAGATLQLSLYWQALQNMEQDYTLLLELQDDLEKAWWAGTFALPNTAYPTGQWQPNEIVHVRLDWLIDAAMPSGRFQLVVNLLDSDGDKVIARGIAIAGVNVQGREHIFARPTTPYVQRADLIGTATLIGYDLASDQVSAGDTVRLTLCWRSRTRMRISYTVFAHLLDSENRIWGQHDSPPCNGECPTTSWLAGEYLTDAFEIELAPEAPSGAYRIGIGMYDAETMTRLQAIDDKGESWPDNRIILNTTLTVE